MNSFMTFIQEKLTPIANFFGAQRHFSAMQKGFMATVSFILVSAIFMIIANPPVTADLIAQGGFWSIFEGWYNFSQTYKVTILIPFNECRIYINDYLYDCCCTSKLCSFG